MNVVVSTGSYECDYKEEYVRGIVVDENGNFYVGKIGDKYFFLGYSTNCSDKKKLIEECMIRDFNGYRDINFLFNLDYYYLKTKHNWNEKRIAYNCLNKSSFYLVHIDSEKAQIGPTDKGYRICKMSFSELEGKMLSSTDEERSRYMETVLKLIPDDLRCKNKVKRKVKF